MKLPTIIDEFLSNHLASGSGQTPVAVVDCDGTIIKGDIGEAMFYFQIRRFLFRESPARLWPDYPERKELGYLFSSLIGAPPFEGMKDGRLIAFANHLLGWYFNQLKRGETEKACSDIVKLWAGFTQAELKEIATDTVKSELRTDQTAQLLGKFVLPRGVRYIRETIEIIRRLRAAEFDTWVVSGSNIWSVSEVCRRLPVREERIAGIDLLRKGTVNLPGVLNPVPVGAGKVELLQARGLPAPSIVVSDSTYDLPLFLASSGLKILIASNGPSEIFFEQTGIRPDETWVRIDQPTLLAEFHG